MSSRKQCLYQQSTDQTREAIAAVIVTVPMNKGNNVAN